MTALLEELEADNHVGRPALALVRHEKPFALPGLCRARTRPAVINQRPSRAFMASAQGPVGSQQFPSGSLCSRLLQ